MTQKGFVSIILVIGMIVILGVVGFLILSRQTPTVSVQKQAGKTFSVAGTVKFIDLEGGFWGIVGDDGNKYDPKNLPKEFQREGLRAKFTLKTAEDQVGIRMWGTIVEVQSYSQELDAVN